MAVSANAREVTYTGDGGTLAFAFSFPVASTSEVKVQSIVTATGAVTDSTASVTISLTAKSSGQTLYPGGTVTFVTAPASTVTVRIWGDTARTSSAIGQNDTLYSAGLETRLDTLTAIVQEIDRDLDKVPRSSNPLDTEFNIPEPSSTYNNYFLGVVSGVYAFVQAVTSTVLAFSGNVAGRIAYFGGTSTISGDSGFTYNDSTDTLSVPNATVTTDLTVTSNIRNTQLTASRVVVTDADKDLASSAVTSTELGYVANVTSAIQTQIDAKLATATAQSDYTRRLARTSGLVTVGNTAVETNILSFTLDANSLATNRAVRIKAYGNWSHDGTNVFDVYLKYGGTTLCNVGGSVDAAGATADTFVVDAVLRANNSASAQAGVIVVTSQDDSSSINQVESDYGTAAEDSTTSLTLTLSVKWGTADTSDTISLAAEAELI